MTATAEAPDRDHERDQRWAQRTYGGWRRSRSLGIGRLGTLASLVLVVAIMVAPIAAVMGAWPVVAVAALVVVVLSAAAFVAVGGVSIGEAVTARVRWWHARLRGWDRYSAVVSADEPAGWQPPGVLARLELREAADGVGGQWGVVRDTQTGLVTAQLAVEPQSTDLVDRHEADGWVAGWHQWLASLGDVPAVSWVAVTVMSGPAAGEDVRAQLHPRVRDDAPPLARSVADELIEQTPTSTMATQVVVSITFDPHRFARRLDSVDEQIAEVSRLLTGLEASLPMAGVAVLGRRRAHEIAADVRAAASPADRGELARARVAGTLDDLGWDEAGPVSAVEQWDRYAHDDGISVSWGWREAPRQRVPADVLRELVEPGVWPRRVTVLLRPLPGDTAHRVLERQVQTMQVRQALRERQQRDTSAREQQDHAQAERAAAEEAAGAGVVLVSLYVTVTVDDAADLDEAIADTTQRATGSRIRLRRLYGGQQAGWATTLGVGIHPPAYQHQL